MGHEVGALRFSLEDHRAFNARLLMETQVLEEWFAKQAFHKSETASVGLELEAWLTGSDLCPAPENGRFLALLDDPDIVPELARYNFEINAAPLDLQHDVFRRLLSELDHTWHKCCARSSDLGLRPVSIGILPSVSKDMHHLGCLSDAKRFAALNNELMQRRGGRPLQIDISGRDDRLSCSFDHIMLEAACTSLQAHLKVNQDEAARLYNASLMAAGPLLAATANSPYLYGKSLWAETRIPAFEQSTALEGFRTTDSRNVLRVTMGTGYLRDSLFELFAENLRFPRLLPSVDDAEGGLAHLRLQNGTIWRWVRPILGFGPGEVPHLRIEMRVMPAGPTTADMVANLAFYFGLAYGLGRMADRPEDLMSFKEACANFYACARDGLQAQVYWRGRVVPVRALLLELLLPVARTALERIGVDKNDLECVFTDILRPRVILGCNGAEWQRSFVRANGSDMIALTEAYAAQQTAGQPVHTWPVPR